MYLGNYILRASSILGLDLDGVLVSRTAITKDQILDGLNNRDFLTLLETRAKIKVYTGLVSSEIFLLGLLVVTFSVSSCGLSSMHTQP